jgi:4-oxalomesaconate hydratase
MTKTALVVSAHSADFVWRAGGAIALHAEQGVAVTVICLSYGERGESAKLWRLPSMTLDRVKAERQAEAKAAAQHLGVHDIQFWDLGDYPIALDQAALFRLVDTYRAIRPAVMLTHSERDIYNHDHPAVTDFAQHARIIAQAHGHKPETKVLGAPPVYLFAKKRAAIECMAGQEHLWEYYTRVGQQRGAQAARNSDKSIAWGEGYQSIFPHVVDTLIPSWSK